MANRASPHIQQLVGQVNELLEPYGCTLTGNKVEKWTVGRHKYVQPPPDDGFIPERLVRCYATLKICNRAGRSGGHGALTFATFLGYSDYLDEQLFRGDMRSLIPPRTNRSRRRRRSSNTEIVLANEENARRAKKARYAGGRTDRHGSAMIRALAQYPTIEDPTDSMHESDKAKQYNPENYFEQLESFKAGTPGRDLDIAVLVQAHTEYEHKHGARMPTQEEFENEQRYFKKSSLDNTHRMIDTVPIDEIVSNARDYYPLGAYHLLLHTPENAGLIDIIALSNRMMIFGAALQSVFTKQDWEDVREQRTSIIDQYPALAPIPADVA